MKEKILAITLAVLLWSVVADAKTAVVSFETIPPITDTEKVCVVLDDEPGIAGRWASGALTSLSGQCTTTAGQTEVELGGVVAGKIWYFTAFVLSADGERSAFMPEISKDVPVEMPEILPLPPIDVNGKTVNITVEIK